MKKKKWYFKNGYEEYFILYEDECFILVQNVNTKKLSFGIVQDFGSFYGFPVNQSCLTEIECLKVLERFIEIDKKYDNRGTLETWESMINVIKQLKEVK